MNTDIFHSIDCLIFAGMSKLQGLTALDELVERAELTQTPEALREDEEDENQLEGREITFGKDDPNVVDDMRLGDGGLRLYYTGNLPNNCRIKLPDELEDDDDGRAEPGRFVASARVGIGGSFVQNRREMKRQSTAYSSRRRAEIERESRYW